MKRFLLTLTIALLACGAAQAYNPLQLYIDGATYDEASQTWVTTSNSFDLYVIGNMELSDVMVSMALGDYSDTDDPNGMAGVSVNGSMYDSFSYGYPPIATVDTWDQSGDLAKHGIFPAWYTEFNAGNFGLVGGVGDVQPDGDGNFYNPADDGYVTADNPNQLGEYKVFSIEVFGSTAVHFDAYTTDTDGNITYFAPFSHDAQTAIPEPATVILFGLGLSGVAAMRSRRRKK
jgi:hypothetical protein